jgi:hypothetical protein
MRFALLRNPILDSDSLEVQRKFYPDEITFLLHHIRSFVHVELFAFQILLRAISEGADSPEALDQALNRLVPGAEEKSFKPSFLSTQRSGALSRMVDLGLIIRKRDGVRVSYAVSDQGRKFAEA